MAIKTRDMDQMVKTLMDKGVKFPTRIISAIRKVPRHKFVVHYPYEDMPVGIGFGQTISQPFIVAYMTNELNIRPLHKVLEIGTGSGYQTALLAELAVDIYSVERIFKLSKRTEKLLRQLGYRNVYYKVGDGYKGWKENAPYDKIIVTAMASEIPQPLVDQLKVGGQMIIPHDGILKLITKTETSYDTYTGIKIFPENYTTKPLIGVVFVPLVKG